MGKIAILAAFTATWLNLGAQSLKGGELNIIKGPGGTLKYTANVSLVVAWPNSLNKSYVKINWGDGSPLDSLPYKNNGCTYDNSTTLHFEGTHTFVPGIYTVSVTDNELLVPGIVNIPNSSSHKLQLRRIINLSVYNEPPLISGCICDSVKCENNKYDDYISSPAVTGGIGDSISYSIVSHPEFSGYSYPPLGIVGGLASSLLSFTANGSGRYNISYRIDEWRKSISTGPYDILIGSTFREVYVAACNISIATEIIEKSGYETDILSFTMYPNPAQDKIVLSSSIECEQLTLVNSMGQLLLVLNKPFPKQEIDISLLPSGIYFLKAESKHKQGVFKVVKD